MGKKTQVTTTESGIVTGGGEKRRWRTRFNGRRVLLIGLVVIILAALGGGGYYWYRKSHQPAVVSGKEFSRKLTNDQLADQVNLYLGQENYDEAIDLLQQQDNQGNPLLRSQLATLYASKGNYDKALELYKKIETAPGLNQSDAAIIGSIYYRKEDFANAATYYQKASQIALASKDTNPLAEADAARYTAIVERIKNETN